MFDSLHAHGLQHTRLPCPSLSHRVFFKFMSIESVMPSNHLILCRPLLFLSSIFSSIRVFSNESALHISSVQFSSIQSLSRVWLFVTPWIAARQASLSITISRSSLKLMSIESVMPSNHLILCPLLFLLPSNFPSIGVFSNESVLCIRWPNYSINSSKNRYSHISFHFLSKGKWWSFTAVFSFFFKWDK